MTIDLGLLRTDLKKKQLSYINFQPKDYNYSILGIHNECLHTFEMHPS